MKISRFSIVVASLAILFGALVAFGQIGSTVSSPNIKYYVSAASSGAAQANNCVLNATGGLTTYISDVRITGDGATTGSVIAITLTGTASTNTPTFYLTVPTGATTAITALDIHLTTPIAASGPNQAITVNVPSFGTGNLSAAVVASGYQTQ
ncbi:MAG TPA: hypothetical protein VGM05_13060 [Planctomycetaceae bacterium]|jgi:hypothetical protein